MEQPIKPNNIEIGSMDCGEKDRFCGYCGNMHKKMTMGNFLGHLLRCETAQAQYHGRKKEQGPK